MGSDGICSDESPPKKVSPEKQSPAKEVIGQRIVCPKIEEGGTSGTGANTHQGGQGATLKKGG